MAKAKLNGSAKWVIVALAVLTVAFNSGILYNDVAHLTEEVRLMRLDIVELRLCLMTGGVANANETHTPTDDR
jgi:hypothetical protein